jgi:hypothetical protein
LILFSTAIVGEHHAKPQKYNSPSVAHCQASYPHKTLDLMNGASIEPYTIQTMDKKESD